MDKPDRCQHSSFQISP